MSKCKMGSVVLIRGAELQPTHIENNTGLSKKQHTLGKNTGLNKI